MTVLSFTITFHSPFRVGASSARDGVTAAIDHNDNMAIANHIRLSAIVLIKRTQTGRATRACTLLLSKGPTFPLSRSTRRAYPSGTQVTLVDGELMNVIARH